MTRRTSPTKKSQWKPGNKCYVDGEHKGYGWKEYPDGGFYQDGCDYLEAKKEGSLAFSLAMGIVIAVILMAILSGVLA